MKKRILLALCAAVLAAGTGAAQGPAQGLGKGLSNGHGKGLGFTTLVPASRGHGRAPVSSPEPFTLLTLAGAAAAGGAVYRRKRTRAA
jgi:hypothetical protein